jgi:Arc/MetJ-type ribon-helix-helix transcriptional regulator
MQVRLSKPELERFITEQVKAGKFPTVDAAIEAAVENMMLTTSEALDDKTIAAINRAEEQLDRGEGIDFEQFAAEMRKKMATR